MSDQKRGQFAACALYLLAGVGLWLVSLFGDRLTLVGTYEEQSMVISLLYYVPFMLLPCFIWVGHSGTDALRLKPMRVGTSIRMILIALVGVMLALYVDTLWQLLWQALGMNLGESTYVRPENARELTLSILSTAFVAPVCEEMLFRGVMLSSWESRGERRAVFVTTVLFTLLHGNWLGVPAELIMGMVLALVVIMTDSIYAGLTVHTVYNAALAILQYMITSPAAETAESAAVTAGDVVLIIIESLIFAFILLVLIAGLIRQYLGNKHFWIHPSMTNEEMDSVLEDHKTSLFYLGKEKPGKLSLGETLVLLAGIVTSAGLLILDIAEMLL